jgi:hypothetical protein
MAVEMLVTAKTLDMQGFKPQKYVLKVQVNHVEK